MGCRDDARCQEAKKLVSASRSCTGPRVDPHMEVTSLMGAGLEECELYLKIHYEILVD